jgi:hypothetical protein
MVVDSVGFRALRSAIANTVFLVTRIDIPLRERWHQRPGQPVHSSLIHPRVKTLESYRWSRQPAGGQGIAVKDRPVSSVQSDVLQLYISCLPEQR